MTAGDPNLKKSLKRRLKRSATKALRKASSLAESILPGPQKVPVPDGKQLFCSQPFERFEVLGGGGDRGETFFCCQNWVTRSIGSISDQPVEKVWNGRSAREFRRSILDGSFEYCREDLCPYLQREEGPVQRVEDVTDPDLLAVIRGGLTVVPFGPKDIICCFDQSCNLSCPSCRTQIIMETEHQNDIRQIQRRLEDEALHDARLLYITGSGDPFGSPFFRKWLQTMDPASMPKLEKLHLHTNALLWTRRIWESIPEGTRRLVRAATISVDAARPDSYRENRRGGEFEILLKRLAFIADLRREGPLEYLEIHMTVQENNFREMAEFLQLGLANACDRVTFHQMVNWGTFTDEEYAARAVHQPEHPSHGEFLAMLHSTALQHPAVNLSNLTELAESTRPHAPVPDDARNDTRLHAPA